MQAPYTFSDAGVPHAAWTLLCKLPLTVAIFLHIIIVIGLVVKKGLYLHFLGVTVESIYLVLTSTGTLFSRFLGLITGARYNHVSLGLDDDIEEFYSFGRKIIWFPLIGGFVVERADKGVFKVFSDTACLIYMLEIEDGQFEKLKVCIDNFKRNQHLYKYNLIGLLGVMFNIPLKRKNRFFCTQFVATMLDECGIYSFHKDLSLATPDDFHRIPGLVKIYEGLLSELSDFRRRILSHTG